MMIIDPPSPFAPVAEWRAFLAELRAIKDPDDMVRQAIAEAEAIIATKEEPIRPIE